MTRITGYPAPPEADGKNLLLRNEGHGVFTDVTDEAGVGACGLDPRDGQSSCFRSMASSWGDFDRDGDLDLYVGNYGYADDTEGVLQEDFAPGEPDFLYQNNGDGTFTDISSVFPPEVQQGYTYQGGFYDLDGDLDLDLYIVNDFGFKYPNRVMWNEDGALVFDPFEASNLVQRITGMGLGVGDLNGDGWLDLLMPMWNANVLLESQPDLGLWIDSTGKRGLGDPSPGGSAAYVGWGGELGDLDNDGDLDAVVQYGHLFTDKSQWNNAAEQPDAMYMNEPDAASDWRFVDRAAEFGADDVGADRGALMVDLDRDGSLDLLKRSLHGPDTLYVSRCSDAAWLEVHLSQPGTMNVFAVGARVEVESGGQVWRRNVYAGGTSYASAGPPEVHFGLGDLEEVDVVRVYWPDGTESEVPGVTTRQQITITRTP